MATNFNIEITSPEGATFNTENKHVGGKIFAVPKLQAKDVAPSASAQSVAPDEGYVGLSAVNVAAIPSDYVIPSGTLQITANGAKDVTNYKNVNVNVEPNLEEKTVTVTTNGTTEVTPSSGKDGISKVTINTNVPTASAVEEVATASAMDALLVEANVGKYYKFTGTTDTNYTNGDLYLVEGAVTETWVLNETLTLQNIPLYNIPFTSGGQSYEGMEVSIDSGGTGYVRYSKDGLQYGSYDEVYTKDGPMNGWNNSKWRTIVYPTPVTDVTLLPWLQANGRKQ